MMFYYMIWKVIIAIFKNLQRHRVRALMFYYTI